MGAVKILPPAFSFASHEFIQIWPLIEFCQMLGWALCIKTADYDQIVFKMKFKTSFFLFILSFYDVVKILLNVRQVFLKGFHGDWKN